MLYLDIINEPIPNINENEIVSVVSNHNIWLPIILAILAVIVIVITRKILKKEIKNINGTSKQI